MHRPILFAAVAGLSLGASMPAFAGIPGDYVIHRMPPCDIAAEGQICRQDVPNGDFEGVDDTYWHGERGWFVMPGPRHSMEAHLRPWVFSGPGSDTYAKAMASFDSHGSWARTVQLSHPGDQIEQFVELPAAEHEDFVYTVHAHVGTRGGGSEVLLHALFGDGVRSSAEIRQSMRTARPVSADQGAPEDELVASVLVKAGSGTRYAGLSFRHVAGAPLRIDDVVIVRSIPGQIPVALASEPAL